MDTGKAFDEDVITKIVTTAKSREFLDMIDEESGRFPGKSAPDERISEYRKQVISTIKKNIPFLLNLCEIESSLVNRTSASDLTGRIYASFILDKITEVSGGESVDKDLLAKYCKG